MSLRANRTRSWKHLVEAAIFETSLESLTRRIQDAQDAVVEQIEVSFHTASQSERQALINAMNSLRHLQRLIPKSDYQLQMEATPLTDA